VCEEGRADLVRFLRQLGVSAGREDRESAGQALPWPHGKGHAGASTLDPRQGARLTGVNDDHARGGGQGEDGGLELDERE